MLEFFSHYMYPGNVIPAIPDLAGNFRKKYFKKNSATAGYRPFFTIVNGHQKLNLTTSALGAEPEATGVQIVSTAGEVNTNRSTIINDKYSSSFLQLNEYLASHQLHSYRLTSLS